jgi:tetratricopeptide (TPR) repeat protein
MADPAKFIDRAEKLLEKGKPDLALAEYRAAIEAQPENDQLLEKAADLSLTLGQLGVASDLLRRLFARSIETRQMTNAGVVFRKLQRLKALDPEMVSRYAELCESTSRKEAAEAYRIAFLEFQRLGDGKRSLACISSSLELEPRLEDYREQARIAEALHERGLAAKALVNLGVMLGRLGQDASEIYARAYADDPSNMAARLGHGRALIAQNRAPEAVDLLQPLATYPSAPEEAREPYALALLAVGRVEEAEPFVWTLFERNPASNLDKLHTVIGGLLDRDHTERAIGLARRLEEFYRKAGRRNEYIQDIARLAETSKPSIPFYEYLAELYNSANREVDYSQLLGRLFELYFKGGNYGKALDALDRAVDIDPYEAEHKERMDRLAGHVSEERLHVVARRLGVDPPEQVTVRHEVVDEAEPTPSLLEDLVLQAELFLQYGMRDKALQKIEQIRRSFAVAVDTDPRVRQLLINAGLPVAPIAAQREAPVAEMDRGKESMLRAAEVSRLIARQSDPRSVLVTAVNQIGLRWHYDRCLAALATPGKAPSLVVEYCSPDVPRSERAAMVRLLALSQRLIDEEPVFRAADVQLSEALTPIRRDLEKLNISSLVVLALMEGDKPIGLLIVQQCGVRRRWSADDVAVLRSLSDQVAQAVHGARLRSLVSNLGVAEEETGLLKKSAYMDAIVAELSKQGVSSSRTLALLQVASLTSASEDSSVTELVRSLRAVAQDQGLQFRYDRDTVALLLTRSNAVETEALVGKLRETLETIGLTICAGIAQAGATEGFDPEDAATEWVNRVARALVLASSIPERICILPPAPAVSA